MCLKRIGVELPLMAGTRPMVFAHVLFDGISLGRLTLRRDHLPVRAPLPGEFKALLQRARRKQGERRARRLTLGPFHRDPYSFYTAKLPGTGLCFPDGTLCGHLGLELYVDSRQPLFHYPVLLHLKGSDPKVHPFGNRLRWVERPTWSLAGNYARLAMQRDESPCGCCVRVRVAFLPLPEVTAPSSC